LLILILFTFIKKTFIPNNRVLRTRLLEIYHDNPISGHLGYKKTKEVISRNCHWEQLEKDVNSWLKGWNLSEEQDFDEEADGDAQVY
jgi:hypothetical protein